MSAHSSSFPGYYSKLINSDHVCQITATDTENGAFGDQNNCTEYVLKSSSVSSALQY